MDKELYSGTTSTGFEYCVNKNIGDDYELYELIEECDRGGARMKELCLAILGAEYYAKLKEHVRDKHGLVRTSAIENELGEIFNTVKQLKN